VKYRMSESRKQRKKRLRQRKRQHEAQSALEQEPAEKRQKLDIDLNSPTTQTPQTNQADNTDEKNKEGGTGWNQTVGGVLQILRQELEKEKEELNKKNVYGVWTEPVPTDVILPYWVPKEKKQHHGLRCKKCLCLLARDCDFEYRNGELWINPDIWKNGWEGIKTKGFTVFCQNMHPIGNKRATTWTNLTKYIPVLKVNKTTFVDNFINNPEFKESDLIKNKLIFSEKDGGEWLRLSLPSKEYLPKLSENICTDRYHQETNLGE